MLRTILSLCLLCNYAGVAASDDQSVQEQLVYAFCYAEQTGQLCDDLKLLLDTKAAFERRNGVSLKGPICIQGLDQAVADEATKDRAALCAKARRRYGCAGTEIPRLLSNWPAGPVCRYP